MKNIVITDEIQTGDFKPSFLTQEYRRLTQEETRTFFPLSSLKECPCPACLSANVKKSFDRFELSYRVCAQCGTWYVSPRPSDEAIIHFYHTSKARQCWNEKIYHSTQAQRKEKIIKPRFIWVEDSVGEYFPSARRYVDINANQPGYIAQIGSLGRLTDKTLVNPLVPVPEKHIHNIALISSPWWDVQGHWDVVTLFEVLDHTADVSALLNKVNVLLPKGGLCFLTGILASGFDLQVLGSAATHIFAPDRLNVLSIDGLKQLILRHGFECLEMSTPGILDLPIVAKAKNDAPQLELGDFVEYLLKQPLAQRDAFAQFLQENLLSSYGRILIRKV